MKSSCSNLNGKLCVLIITLLYSCNPGTVTRRKLIDIIDHNQALNQVREINGIQVGLKYFPYQLLVLQELENRKNNTDSAYLGKLEKKYSGQYYFRLAFSKNNKEVIRQLNTSQQYNDILQTMAFGMGSHIKVTTEQNDTIPLKDYAFEQVYGLSSANNLLLVFNKNDFIKASTFYVDIGEFGLGTGNVRFSFTQKELKEIPALNYQRID